MAWPNPFRRKRKNDRTCWGYTFELTNDHLTPEQTYPLKYSYDRLGDESLQRLDEIAQSQRSLLSRERPSQSARPALQNRRISSSNQKSVIVAKRDLYISLRENAQSDPLLGQLWAEAHAVPEWVDWGKVARGQDVFYRYGGPALTGLAFQSLLGGMVNILNQTTHTPPLTMMDERVRTE